MSILLKLLQMIMSLFGDVHVAWIKSLYYFVTFPNMLNFFRRYYSHKEYVVATFFTQLLVQFNFDSFETLQILYSW